MIQELRRTMGMMCSMYCDNIAAVDPSHPRNEGVAFEPEQLSAMYRARMEYLWHAVAFASAAGFRVGVKIDPAQPGWPVVYIDLPTGQVSWHIPEYAGEYDGHTTEHKYNRIEAFAAWEDGPAPEVGYPPCGQVPCEHAPDGGNHPVSP